MVINRKVSVELEEKDKEALRAAHAILVEIAELAGGTCLGCPLLGYCGRNPECPIPECPDAVIEDVFFELTGEAI